MSIVYNLYHNLSKPSTNKKCNAYNTLNLKHKSPTLYTGFAYFHLNLLKKKIYIAGFCN